MQWYTKQIVIKFTFTAKNTNYTCSRKSNIFVIRFFQNMNDVNGNNLTRNDNGFIKTNCLTLYKIRNNFSYHEVILNANALSISERKTLFLSPYRFECQNRRKFPKSVFCSAAPLLCNYLARIVEFGHLFSGLLENKANILFRRIYL